MEWLNDVLSAMLAKGWVDFMVYIMLGCIAVRVIGRVLRCSAMAALM